MISNSNKGGCPCGCQFIAQMVQRWWQMISESVSALFVPLNEDGKVSSSCQHVFVDGLALWSYPCHFAEPGLLLFAPTTKMPWGNGWRWLVGQVAIHARATARRHLGNFGECLGPQIHFSAPSRSPSLVVPKEFSRPSEHETYQHGGTVRCHFLFHVAWLPSIGSKLDLFHQASRRFWVHSCLPTSGKHWSESGIVHTAFADRLGVCWRSRAQIIPPHSCFSLPFAAEARIFSAGLFFWPPQHPPTTHVGIISVFPSCKLQEHELVYFYQDLISIRILTPWKVGELNDPGKVGVSEHVHSNILDKVQQSFFSSLFAVNYLTFLGWVSDYH